MSLKRLFKNVIIFLLIASVAAPLAANALSLSALVEAHQERMQRKYERMSYRLCTAVSGFLPFVKSEKWCLGEQVKLERSADDHAVSTGTDLQTTSFFELSTTTELFVGGIAASTTSTSTNR